MRTTVFASERYVKVTRTPPPTCLASLKLVIAAFGVLATLIAAPVHAMVYDFLLVTTNSTSGTFTSTNGNGTITATTAGSLPLNLNNTVFTSYFPVLFPSSGLVQGYITRYDDRSSNTTVLDLTNYKLSPKTVFGIWNMTEESNSYSIMTLAGTATNAPPGFTWSLLGYDDDANNGSPGWVHIVLNPNTGNITMVPFANTNVDSDGAFWTNIAPATTKIIIAGKVPLTGPGGTQGGGDGVVYYFAEPRPCQMTCPSNITITICGQGTNVFFPPPTLGGDCGTNTPVLLSDLGSGSFFPLGTNYVAYAVPGYTNAACSFTVTVLNSDTNPPVITCPSNIVIFTCSASAVATYAATATDDSGIVTILYSTNSGSVFPLGTNQVSCTAIDGCSNTATCAFNVIVLQNLPTWSVVCPSESTSINVTGCPPVMPSLTNLVTITNQCPIPGGLTITQSPLAGAPLSAGPHQVMLTVCATNGNCSNCLVSVNATISSGCCAIACPTNTLTITTCGSNAVATFATPSLSGPCVSNTTVVCAPPSGSTFPLGTNLVICTATNGAGVTLASCSFSVAIVKDAFTNAYDFLPVFITGAGAKFVSPNGHGVITVTNTGGPFLGLNNTTWSSQFPNLFPASTSVPGWLAQANNNANYTNTFYLNNYTLTLNTVFGIWNMTEEANTYSIKTFAGVPQNAPVFTWSLMGYDDDPGQGNIGWVHIVLNAGSGNISTVPFTSFGVDSDAAFWTNIPPATTKIVVTGHLGANNADGVVFYFAERRPCPTIPCPFCAEPITASIVGANIVLSWRADTTTTNYVLEETSDLTAPPPNWTPVTDPPITANGENHVTLPAQNPRRYYRLRQAAGGPG